MGRVTLLIWLLGLVSSAKAQDPARDQTTDSILVSHVVIEGNKVTKDYIILRELPFRAGGSIHIEQLEEILLEAESLIDKTQLFKSVEIAANVRAFEVSVTITVEERWYIFPLPVFELADRNFNVWWSDFDRDIRRTIFGMRFYHLNLTGRADQLRGVAEFGFNQEFGLRYKLPFFSQESPLGITIGGDLERTRDVNYVDSANKQLFFRGDEVTRQLRKVYSTLSARQTLYVWHLLTIAYNDNIVSDTILALNPDYFASGVRQQYLSATYEIIGDWRDRKSYPSAGPKLSLQLKKDGIGLFNDYSRVLFLARLEGHLNPVDRIILSSKFVGKVSSINEQPYHNYRGLGYGNTLVRGYERYVVNGKHYALLQNAVKFRFLSFVIRDLFKKSAQLRNIPFDFYLKPHADVAWVEDPFFVEQNNLAESPLLGYGIGLDIVTYYDLVLSINFSINRLGENGVYLHFNL